MTATSMTDDFVEYLVPIRAIEPLLNHLGRLNEE
jgi:hypothetical protein